MVTSQQHPGLVCEMYGDYVLCEYQDTFTTMFVSMSLE